MCEVITSKRPKEWVLCGVESYSVPYLVWSISVRRGAVKGRGPLSGRTLQLPGMQDGETSFFNGSPAAVYPRPQHLLSPMMCAGPPSVGPCSTPHPGTLGCDGQGGVPRSLKDHGFRPPGTRTGILTLRTAGQDYGAGCCLPTTTTLVRLFLVGSSQLLGSWAGIGRRCTSTLVRLFHLSDR